jgi:hypothetical protein
MSKYAVEDADTARSFLRGKAVKTFTGAGFMVSYQARHIRIQSGLFE